MAEMHNKKTAIIFQARPRYKSLTALLTAIDRIIMKTKIGVPMKTRRRKKLWKFVTKLTH
jgi:ADP-heptose:LPS heptosyltransferase